MTIDVILQTLTLIILTAATGAVNALLGYFLDYCFYKGSIFGGYLPRVAAMCLKVWGSESDKIQVKIFKTAGKRCGREAAADHLCELAQDMPLYKLLGGCVICFNVWLSVFTYSVIYASVLIGSNYYLPWYYVFVHVVVSSFVLRRIV
jgi:hypothetical protein